MEIKELLEKVTMDMLMEGCGLVFSLTLIYYLFVDGGMGTLIEMFGMVLCG